MLMFLFIRVLPVISIAEMRELVAETQERAEPQAQPAQTPS
jgi:molybdopterin-containing oxidoreductase family membrane subunit